MTNGNRFDRAEIKIVKKSAKVPKPIERVETSDVVSGEFDLLKKSDRERRRRIVSAQAAICTALVLVLALIRSGNGTFSKKASEYIKSVVTAEVTPETAIGALKFVRSETERAVAVFAGNDVPTGVALSMPVNGSISGRFIKGVHEKIEISSAAGCAVTSPMAGTILGTLSDDTGVAVAIESGEYVLILQGLEECSINKGAMVATGEAIGKARNGTDAVVYMTLYHGDNRIDPLPYISGIGSE